MFEVVILLWSELPEWSSAPRLSNTEALIYGITTQHPEVKKTMLEGPRSPNSRKPKIQIPFHSQGFPLVST